MPSNPDNRPNKKDSPNPFERHPKTVNPETARKLGKTAIKGPTKDKPKQ